MSQHPKLDAIRRAATSAEIRMRLARMIQALPTSATLALATVGLALALRKMAPEHFLESWSVAMMVGAGLSVVISLAVALLQRLPPGAGALALDAHHGLSGRLTNALDFIAVPESERSPLMDAAIEDACDTARDLSARSAVRIAFPVEIAISAAVAAAVAGISLLQVNLDREVPKPKKLATTDTLDMPDDEIAKFEAAIQLIKEQNPALENDPVVQKFNQLVEDLKNRRLNREDAFRRMQEIESDLRKGAEAEKKALEEQLKETAKELDKSVLSKPVGQSLKKKDFKQAQKDLRDLAKKLRAKKKPTKAELERLRKALERAANKKKEALQALIKHRNELSEQILQKKQELKNKKFENQKEKEKEEALLRKKERELERLNRQIQSRQAAQRRLSKLDRQLGQAAANLARDLGLSAEDLEQLAEELNRLEQQEMNDEAKEKLRKRLQELREQIRQDGQRSKQMRERLQKFLEQARGNKKGQGQGKQGQGKQGQGKKGQGQGQQGQGKQGQGQGQQGQGQQGQGMGPGQGQGQQGQGQGEGPGGFMLGPGGIPIPIPGAEGEGEGEGEGDGKGGDKPGGEGNGKGGDSFGTGSGGSPEGEKSTDIDAKNRDVYAQGVDHKGPTRAEVILDAAKRGFRARPYRKVYREYRTIAEDRINRQKIPDGMKFYVRRYFDLIRPPE